ncbi:acyl-CoA dehydrogenase family protein [Novosphingobium sp.]|uniref:acyl-CoA dehydrogenase family protein n=1 Tax=Novosphingobium sp. TaxID=1874826 RepID=UPI003BACF6E6
MIERTVYSAEHEDFRRSYRHFLETRIRPNHARYEAQGYVDHEMWLEAGREGFLCPTMPEEFGGAGADRGFPAVMLEEQGHAGLEGPGFSLHSDIVAPYILGYGSAAQKQAFLPKMATGEMIGAIAMTEPGTGSDVQAIATTAVEDGDDFIINGSKIFITNGFTCHFAIVACKTGPKDGGASAISLVILEADRPGFGKAERPLHKMGMKAQDTSELFFDNVRVPQTNLLGPLNGGFKLLMHELAWERMQIALWCVPAARAAFEESVAYAAQRKTFGKPLHAHQDVRFKLAHMRAEISVAQSYVDDCLRQLLTGSLAADDAAMAKYWTTEMYSRVADTAVQIHGGYGYMWEYPVAHRYAEARVKRIYGGTSEIMKEVIARGITFPSH